MTKRIITILLAITLFATSALPIFSANAEEVERKYITVETQGDYYKQPVYKNGKGTIFVPIDMLTWVGGMPCTGVDQYIFYYKSEADRYKNPLKGAKRIIIDEDGKTGKVVCYTSTTNYVTIENITFSESLSMDGELYLPIAEFLPLLDAKIEITNDGIVHISPNPVPLYRALYSYNLDLWTFDSGEILADEFITATGLIVDTIFGRYDRLDFVTKSGEIKDYSNLFKELLVDNETYLSAFDQKETPLDKSMEWLDTSAGNFDDIIDGGKNVLSYAEYISKSDLHKDAKDFGDSLKQFKGNAKVLGGVIKVIEYAHAYYNQVDDHRNMLVAVYAQGTRPAALAANEVYTLYSSDAGQQITSAVTVALREYIVDEAFDAIIEGVGLEPFKISTEAVKLVFKLMPILIPDYPDVMGTIADAAELYFLDNVVEDAYAVATKQLSNFKVDAASLEKTRLSLIMTLVASKYGFVKHFSEDREEVEIINQWLEQLYLAADSVECVAKGYYGSKKNELSKRVKYIKPEQTNQDPSEPTDPTDPTDPILAGTCGKNLTWSFSHGTLTISGTGAMDDYSGTDLPGWQEIKDDIYDIVIEEGVTFIGEYAFADMPKVRRVAIADTVTKIKDAAFMGCTRLWDVEIPSGVTVIEYATFGGCENMDSVTIPKTVTHIETYAFMQCDSLEDVYYEGSEEAWNEINIEWYDYNNDDGSALDANTGLRGATIHFNTPLEEDEPMDGTCGENVTWHYANGTLTISGNGAMEDYWFGDVPGWSEIKDLIDEIVIQEGVTYIGRHAFENMPKLKNVDIAGTVNKIGECAFMSCMQLDRLEIPNGVTVIANAAFADCTSMISVTLPKSVTRIEQHAFTSCGLEDVYYEGSEEEWKEIDIEWHDDGIVSDASVVSNASLYYATKHFNDWIPDEMPGGNETGDPTVGDGTGEENSNTITVPSLIGMEQIAALRLLKELGLNWQVYWNVGDVDGEILYIVEQSIPAGTSVEPGTMVELRISATAP